jgi:ABC-2 type transport system permease protein
VTLTVLALGLTLGLPVSLSFIAKIYLPEIIVGYLGILLLAAFYISITMFFSSLTKNQVLAFLGSVIVIFFILIIGSDFLANVLPKALLDFFSFLTPPTHLQNFIKGVIDIRSLIYFISLSAAVLFLTMTNLEKRD